MNVSNQFITCVTGNAGKWRIFQETLGEKLTLVQQKMDTPEIQSIDVAEIAKFSADWAAKKLNRPVISNDVGYYVSALGGFPGPFVKWMNQTLTPEQVLAMMKGAVDRSVVIRSATVYAEPDGFNIVPLSERKGFILEVPYAKENAWNSVFDCIMEEEGRRFAIEGLDAQLDFLCVHFQPSMADLSAKIIAHQNKKPV